MPTAANKTVDMLNKLGCAWLAIGHTPRDNANHLFGSQMFTAAADMEWKINTVNEENAMFMKLTSTKNNETAVGNQIGLRMEMKHGAGISSLSSISPSLIPDVETAMSHVAANLKINY